MASETMRTPLPFGWTPSVVRLVSYSPVVVSASGE